MLKKFAEIRICAKRNNVRINAKTAVNFDYCKTVNISTPLMSEKLAFHVKSLNLMVANILYTTHAHSQYTVLCTVYSTGNCYLQLCKLKP